jgi:uncharacterized membrane protein
MENAKTHFQGGKFTNHCFFKSFFVAQQILQIVGSQIEVERVFNIINICTNM